MGLLANLPDLMIFIYYCSSRKFIKCFSVCRSHQLKIGLLQIQVTEIKENLSFPCFLQTLDSFIPLTDVLIVDRRIHQSCNTLHSVLYSHKRCVSCHISKKSYFSRIVISGRDFIKFQILRPTKKFEIV